MIDPDGIVVAVLGASRFLGHELLQVLQERQFPIKKLSLLETEVFVAEVDAVEGSKVALLSDKALADCTIAFCCLDEEQSAKWIPRATAAGAVVIDLSQIFADDDDVPVIVPEVNSDSIGDHEERPVLASPAPGAVALAVALKPLDDAARLKRVTVASYESVSSVGRGGIDELTSQVRDLLSGRSVEPAAFPHQIGFNVVPQTGEFLAGGATRGEARVASHLRRILDLPDLRVHVTSVVVPTFHGQGYAVCIETEEDLSPEEARELLRGAPGILLIDDLATNAYPTLLDAVSEDAVFVGRVRSDLSVEAGLSLWVAIDGARKGAAVNAVQIAEVLLRDHLRARH